MYFIDILVVVDGLIDNVDLCNICIIYCNGNMVKVSRLNFVMYFEIGDEILFFYVLFGDIIYILEKNKDWLCIFKE